LENNSLFGLFRNFAKRSLDFSEINHGPNIADFALRPLRFSEINPKLEKYLQKGP
jgi:hypothetical protein